MQLTEEFFPSCVVTYVPKLTIEGGNLRILRVRRPKRVASIADRNRLRRKVRDEVAPITGRNIASCGLEHGFTKDPFSFGAARRQNGWKFRLEVGTETRPVGPTEVDERLPGADIVVVVKLPLMLTVGEGEQNGKMIRVER